MVNLPIVRHMRTSSVQEKKGFCWRRWNLNEQMMLFNLKTPAIALNQEQKSCRFSFFKEKRLAVFFSHRLRRDILQRKPQLDYAHTRQLHRATQTCNIGALCCIAAASHPPSCLPPSPHLTLIFPPEALYCGVCYWPEGSQMEKWLFWILAYPDSWCFLEMDVFCIWGAMQRLQRSLSSADVTCERSGSKCRSLFCFCIINL